MYVQYGLGGAVDTAKGAASDYLASLVQKSSGEDNAYADKAMSALGVVIKDPQAMAALSPTVRLGVTIAKVAISELSSAEGGSSLLPAAVMAFINDVSNTAATISSEVGQALSSVGDALPIIGAAISMFSSAEELISQQKQAVMQNLAAGCANSYVPVLGTGRGKKIMPADIFVSSWAGGKAAVTVAGPGGKTFLVSPAVAGFPVPTGLGEALIAMTECIDNVPGRGMGSPNMGVPAARRALFRQIRKAIEASAVHPELTDGGASLWPIYLDLLRSEFDAGHLTSNYAAYLWVLSGQSIGPGAAQPGGPTNSPHTMPDDCILNLDLSDGCYGLNAMAALIGRYDIMSPFSTSASEARAVSGCIECKKFDQRAIQSAMVLVDDWRDAVNPVKLKWGSDIAAYAKEQSILASVTNIARSKLGKVPAKAPAKPVAKPAAKKPAAAPAMLVMHPARMSMASAIFVGLAVGSIGLVSLEILKRRRRK